MRIHGLKTLALLFLALVISFNAAADTVERYRPVISRLMNSMRSIMERQQRADDVAAVYTVAQQHINSGTLIFEIDESQRSIISGASFGFSPGKNQTYLTFGTGFLDSYAENSSIHHAILMHELRHLYDYLTQREAFISAQEDIKELYWFELDAYHIEAEFVIHYLEPEYRLSAFERDLAKSFREDNLHTISLVLRKESMDVFFFITRMEQEFRQGKHDSTALLRQLIAQAKSHLAAYERYGYRSDFPSYELFHNLVTYNRYLFKLVPLLLNEPGLTWGAFFTRYPDCATFHNRVMDLIETHGPKYDDYASGLLSRWEANLTIDVY